MIPYGVAGAVPALTRPGPCLDGQMTFGTVARAQPSSIVAADDRYMCTATAAGDAADSSGDPEASPRRTSRSGATLLASPAMDLSSISVARCAVILTLITYSAGRSGRLSG